MEAQRMLGGEDLAARIVAPTAADVEEVAVQLGRRPRSMIGVAARCACGVPTVIVTRPVLDDGSPFPTFYYLTHPAAVAAMSRLEAAHAMVEFEAMLAADDGVQRAYREAHAQYLAVRRLYGDPQQIAGVSAGGMPTRVKCLHALAAHALAAGPGQNPIGDLALERAGWDAGRCACGEVSPSRGGVGESASFVGEIHS